MACETLLDVGNQAQVAELVDAMVSNTIGVKPVSVRVRPWVFWKALLFGRAFLFSGNWRNFTIFNGRMMSFCIYAGVGVDLIPPIVVREGKVFKMGAGEKGEDKFIMLEKRMGDLEDMIRRFIEKEKEE